MVDRSDEWETRKARDVLPSRVYGPRAPAGGTRPATEGDEDRPRAQQESCPPAGHANGGDQNYPRFVARSIHPRTVWGLGRRAQPYFGSPG